MRIVRTYNFFSTTPPSFRFFFAVFTILACFLAVSFAGLLAAIPLFEMDLSDIGRAFSDYESTGRTSVIRYFQIIQSLGLFVIPSFIIGLMYSRSSINYLKLDSLPGFSLVMISVLLIIVTQPFINLVASFNKELLANGFFGYAEQWILESEQSAMKQVDAFMRAQGFSGLVLNIFTIALIPAIGEELLFRGILQRLFADWTSNIHAGILISALVFSAIHFQFYGFLPRLFLGVLFGYLLVWSGSLWLPVFIHFVNNALAVVVMHCISTMDIGPGADSIGGSEDTVVYGIFSFFLTVVLLVIIIRKAKRGL
ncbi:MAG: CPBP family intramembrane metalloprotease [Bacteroidetes bacterium]|nr:CPBP family intramembrane metalloprotease [Bacteroidota bacterium]